MLARIVARMMMVVGLAVALLGLVGPVSADGAIVTEAQLEARQPTAIGPTERFTIRFTELLCLDEQDDNTWPNADRMEPYVILGLIKPGGLYGYTLSFYSTPQYSDVDTGDVRYPNLTLMNQHVHQAVAIVAMTMEEDDEGSNTVYEAAKHHAMVNFNFALNNGVRDLTTLRQRVADGFVQGAGVDHDGNDDDRIGSPIQTTVSYTSFDNLVVGERLLIAREASGEGAKFRLTFEVKRTQ